MRLPFAALALGLAAGEALVAVTLGILGQSAPGATALAALGAMAVMLAAALAPLWLLDLLARTRGVRALGRGLLEAFAAGRSVALACTLVAGALGTAATVTFYATPFLTEPMSARFALAATVLLAVASTALMLGLAAAPGHALGRRLALPPRARAFDYALAPALGALAAGALAATLIDVAYAPALGLAFASCAAALLVRARARVLRVAPALALVLSWGAVAGLERLPPGAKELLAYRAPYASLALGLAQRAVDEDGDGASPIALGGDCNDGDPRIHPEARDAPENGIDENCNGSDAPLYRLPAVAPPPRAARPAELADKNDLILILVDGLRPDHLSLDGYGRKTSPHIDALAREGTWFRRAYTTAPSTRFAVSSLFTGRDVRRLDYRDNERSLFRLMSGAPTLAKRLSAAGYRSIGFTVTYVAQHIRGVGQGFDVWRTPWPLAKWRKVRHQKAEQTTQAVLEELARAAPDQPLFLYAHYYCTHEPFYLYPPHDFGRSKVDRYDSGVAHCDAQIGRVLEALRKRPRWDRTAVFVVSDHGELFGEHGLSGHGNSLYEPDVRITMIGRVPHGPAQVIEQPVQLHWLAPTLLELASVAPSPEDDAVSLLDVLLGLAPSPERPLFTFARLKRGTTRYSASAVLEWPYKFIRDHRARTSGLYDLRTDPEELRSLDETRPALAGRLSDLLEGYESWLKVD